MNSYELSRKWFDFCFENPEKIKPNHAAMYFFAIEHCNRLGWKKKFGFPSTMVMEAVGIKSYNTYINTLNELVEFGFIEIIERSKNQYSSNIIALSNFNKALNKALDKALVKHSTKQSESTSESTSESIDSIDKQVTSNKEQETSNNIDEIQTLKDIIFKAYNFNDQFYKRQNIEITKFCETVNLEHATNQIKSYLKYTAKENNKFRVSYQKLIGAEDLSFNNGIWNQENWTDKLKLEETSKSNGDRPKTAAERMKAHDEYLKRKEAENLKK